MYHKYSRWFFSCQIFAKATVNLETLYKGSFLDKNLFRKVDILNFMKIYLNRLFIKARVSDIFDHRHVKAC